MAAIQARKSPDGEVHYRVLVRLTGHPVQTATFRRKTDAKRWAQQVEVAIRNGRYFKTQEAKRRTLGDLVDRYVDEVLSTRPKGKKKLTALLTRWKKELGDFVLSDIKPARIAEVRDRLRRETTIRGEKRSPATVNRYLGALSHAYTVAIREWGWVEDHPVRKVERCREARGRVRYLDDRERRRLLDACHENPERRLYPLVVLAISTGARQGELMALRWRDIDLQRGVAILHHTKNRERRAIPLTGPALELMKEWATVQQIDTDLVFAGPKGKPAFPRKAWDAVLEETGIEDFQFHDLRHTAASYLAMSGATLAELAEILGHKTLQMVKRYSHLSQSHTHAVVARMNAAYL